MSSKKPTIQTDRLASGKPDGAISGEQLRTLAGGIAHDLNTVITTIYGFSELALESLEVPSEAAQDIHNIIRAADKAKSLTGQLFDLSRMTEQEMITVSVEEVVTDTLDLLMPSVPDNVTLLRCIKTPDIRIEAVPEKLFRVFMNIAVNALQSMEGKGGMLTVTIDSEVSKGINMAADEQRIAVIRFEDTGKGMEGETAAYMFSPFFTEGKGEKGRGLGLSIVYDIVREHGGKLRVRSEKGKGTVVEVLLPAVTFGSAL